MALARQQPRALRGPVTSTTPLFPGPDGPGAAGACRWMAPGRPRGLVAPARPSRTGIFFRRSGPLDMRMALDALDRVRRIHRGCCIERADDRCCSRRLVNGGEMVSSSLATTDDVDGCKQGAVRSELKFTNRRGGQSGVADERGCSGCRVDPVNDGATPTSTRIHDPRRRIDRKRRDGSHSHLPHDRTRSRDWVDGEQVAASRVGPEERPRPRNGMRRSDNDNRPENSNKRRQRGPIHETHPSDRVPASLPRGVPLSQGPVKAGGIIADT